MGAAGAGVPLCFSDSYIARLNFIHTDHTALAIEPPFTKPSSYASLVYKIHTGQMFDSHSRVVFTNMVRVAIHALLKVLSKGGRGAGMVCPVT